MKADKTNTRRRQHRRYPISGTVTFEVSAPLTMDDTAQEESDSQNVSKQGLCLITKRTLEKSQIIKLNFPIPDVDVTISTLAEVRWIKSSLIHDLSAGLQPLRSAQLGARKDIVGQPGEQYVIGLRFLF